MSDDPAAQGPDPGVVPVLQQRWSPREFDDGHAVSADEVAVLLEAARWAPSAGNSQPWAFHAVRREQPERGPLLAAVAPSARRWAGQASVLVVNLAHRHVEGTDGDYSEFADYDLGQAVAHMTIQAHSQGLACRQFRAFDKDGVAALLEVPPHWDVVTMTAIGRPAGETSRSPGGADRQPSVAWPLD